MVARMVVEATVISNAVKSGYPSALVAYVSPGMDIKMPIVQSRYTYVWNGRRYSLAYLESPCPTPMYASPRKASVVPNHRLLVRLFPYHATVTQTGIKNPIGQRKSDLPKPNDSHFETSVSVECCPLCCSTNESKYVPIPIPRDMSVGA